MKENHKNLLIRLPKTVHAELKMSALLTQQSMQEIVAELIKKHLTEKKL